MAAEPDKRPLVSVCIPVLNGGELIVRAVQSALDQDYPRTEVVVVDDASTDGTPELLQNRFGDRVRLLRNTERAGQGRTANTAIAQSRGPFVKFLDHDDFLDPDSVSEMAEQLITHRSVGIAFGRRRLELDEDLAAGPEWRERFAHSQDGWSEVKPVNKGSDLLRQLIDDGLRSNWVGEPSSVMVRRSCLASTGGFSVRTRHWTDFDLWVRILAHSDAAFIDKELSTYRCSNDSLTGRNTGTGVGWMDRMWIIEALLSFPEIRDRYPELVRMRSEERHMAWRTAVRGALGMKTNSGPHKVWLDYVEYRVRSRIAGADLFGHPVEPTTAA